jgi:hypothetical protein
MVKQCVKKPYEDKRSVEKAIFILLMEEHKNFFGKLIRWSWERCEQCHAYHVVRHE